VTISLRTSRVALVMAAALTVGAVPAPMSVGGSTRATMSVPGQAGPTVADACGAMQSLAPGVCTHGDDQHPAAAAQAGANAAGEPVPSDAITCVGSGTDGQRVEVLYLYGSQGSALTGSRASEIRRWAGQVEWTVQRSASRLNGDRRVRWVTDGDCRVVVRSVRVSDDGLGDFATMIDELQAGSYSRRDRTYLMFVQSSKYCGIATAPQDDSRSSNLSTRSSGYARIDTGCWDAGDEGYHSIAAHELMHTLGAVQQSAPHSTKGAHCTDDYDLMCYDDGSGSTMSTVCRDNDSSTSGAGDGNDRLLDCGGDDYFHPAPRSGSYLAQQWNTAEHPRLYDPSAPDDDSDDEDEDEEGGGGGGGRPSLTSDPIGFLIDLVNG
jgi:hypothetical protein